MLYPSIQKLTNDKVNRYMLVMAAAKCARHITQEVVDEHNRLALERTDKESKNDVVPSELKEKAVSMAVKRLDEGEYKIIVD